MPNSTQTPTNQATFTANQSVLVPSVGNSYTLQRCGELHKLFITDDQGERHYYLDNGKVMSDDVFSDLFQDTPANRQALNALYGMDYPIQNTDTAGRHAINTNHLQPPHNPNRTVIDVSDVDDREVIVIPSIDLSDVACSLESIITTFEDLGDLFYLLEQGKVDNVGSVARLTQSAIAHISNLAYDNYQLLANTLKQSSYAVKEGI